jgi:hypothetical protein
MNLKKTYRAVLLAALGLASLTTAQAAAYNGDLIVGFTSQSGTDLIYDLGAASSLFNGETWTLTPLLLSYNLNTVNWGVIGDKNLAGVRTAWTTTTGYTPNPVPNTTTWGNLDTAASSIYSNFGTAGAGQSISIDSADQNSWNQQTIVGSLTTQYVNAYGNPNVVGLTSDSFFSMVANGSSPTPLGNFSLDNTGVLTFNAQPVPEPAAASLIGGGALLMLVLRSKFRRHQS